MLLIGKGPLEMSRSRKSVGRIWSILAQPSTPDGPKTQNYDIHRKWLYLSHLKTGRPDGIRIRGLFVPNEALYQVESARQNTSDHPISQGRPQGQSIFRAIHAYAKGVVAIRLVTTGGD